MARLRVLALFLLFCYGITSFAMAQSICPLNSNAIKPKEVKSLESFRKIPILDNGRVKPLDTYAENILLQFSGRRSYEKTEAIRWLARVLFAPEMTREDKVFLINHPAILEDLKIPEEKKRRYSYAQL